MAKGATLILPAQHRLREDKSVHNGGDSASSPNVCLPPQNAVEAPKSKPPFLGGRVGSTGWGQSAGWLWAPREGLPRSSTLLWASGCGANFSAVPAARAQPERGLAVLEKVGRCCIPRGHTSPHDGCSAQKCFLAFRGQQANVPRGSRPAKQTP